MPEAWLEGPVPDVPDELLPVAHSLIDASREFEAASSGLDLAQLRATPLAVDSVGLRVRHGCGPIDRLITYARGESLSAAQLEALRREGEPGDPPETAAALMEQVRRRVASTLDVLRATDPSTLSDGRTVGRAGLPSTVRGLLFHVAEHTRRHAGQVIVTARVVRGMSQRSTTVG